MKKRLQFGKVKKQIDYDMIRIIGIWVFKILLVCLLAFVTVFYFDGRSETPVIPCAPPF
ncbi:MAG: hypothetical protein ACLUUO_07970 [Sellimonas intestinalis]